MLQANQVESTITLMDAASGREVPTKKTRVLRVYMMDLWSFIPYYMARLSAALKGEAVDVTLGSVRYHLDRQYLHNSGLVPDRCLLDLGGSIPWPWMRRIVKSCEYITNLMFLALRLLVSRPDIVHIQYLPFLERKMPFELWFLSWIRKRGIRVVYTVHNVTRQDAPEEGLDLFRRAYWLADALICHGEEARSELTQRFDIPSAKTRVIPHGPLFETGPRISTSEARASLGLPQGELLVLSLGVISEYKGILFLLESWKKLKQNRTPGRLLIAGTGDPAILTSICEKVEAEGLGDSVLLWLRFIAVEQLPLLYQAADILVFPYKAGTTSGAFLTGRNYGKPVITTTLPFFREHLKHGQTGIMVDYGDVDAMGSGLEELILRPQLRAALASALNREASGASGWEDIARKTRELYEAVVPDTPTCL